MRKRAMQVQCGSTYQMKIDGKISRSNRVVGGIGAGEAISRALFCVMLSAILRVLRKRRSIRREEKGKVACARVKRTTGEEADTWPQGRTECPKIGRTVEEGRVREAVSQTTHRILQQILIENMNTGY